MDLPSTTLHNIKNDQKSSIKVVLGLKTPLSQADRIYKMYATRLEKLGIITIGDFLYHIPFRYEDYSLISNISRVQPGEIVTIRGTVTDIKNEFTKNFKRIQKAVVTDKTGSIEVIWFNQPFLLKTILKESRISLSGKIGWFLRKKVMESPDYELLYENSEPIHTGRLIPVYPETRGVSSKWLRRQVYKILKEQKQNLFEYLPGSILNNIEPMKEVEALEQVHFPKTTEQAEKARKRLSFDELFLIQLSGLQKRREWEKLTESKPFSITKYKKQIETFWEKLPFELTNAQKRAVKDIFKDLASKIPMNRLLEGDVGSGKTVVSAIAMYLSFLNGYQSVLMAPTEILANQHYNTIKNLLETLGVSVVLKTGGSKYKVSGSRYNILIGTHAVLEGSVQFEKLGLVVIDEQQRFGVEQRGIIRKKGENPHLLTMTATPIPRTVALTLYGDLDLSYLDEMPKGRKLIKTWLVPSEKRESGYTWIEEQIKQHKTQAFIVCPFIEESESMTTVKAATKEFEHLKKVFTKLKLGLLHGKMKSKEKEEVLQKFRNQTIDILVATPVVEVGIDFPNASIMVIEAAERFGLSQLHQLRGRVGRGNKQSYCLLFAETKNELTLKRLKSLEKTFVGAELAELDLKLRGPGDMYGTMQHGLKSLKIASFSNFPLIEQTRREAEKIFPKLSEYPLLVKKLEEVTVKTVTPD